MRRFWFQLDRLFVEGSTLDCLNNKKDELLLIVRGEFL
jgi:hypothetical protein